VNRNLAGAEKRKVLVYVQAIPVGPDGTVERSFEEYFLGATEFALSHSSKVALSKALLLGTMDVTAVGYAPVLHEALARGASNSISVSVCDTPFEQAKTFPSGDFEILVGENPDGFFSGASLAGALVALRDYTFRVWDEERPEYLGNSVVLVKDLLSPTPEIDIRRIRKASEAKFDAEAAIGRSRISPTASSSSRSNEILTGNPADLSSALKKRLRRSTGIV